TRRAFSPKGAIRSIRLPIQKLPPWGAMESPKTEMISDGARGLARCKISAMMSPIRWLWVMPAIGSLRRLDRHLSGKEYDRTMGCRWLTGAIRRIVDEGFRWRRHA